MSTGDWDPIVKSDEYKRGWYDGFNAAKQPHAIPPPNLTGAPGMPISVKCNKCNMTFQGATSYYCSQIDCPLFLKAS
jgi:hypothetical protein